MSAGCLVYCHLIHLSFLSLSPYSYPSFLYLSLPLPLSHPLPPFTYPLPLSPLRSLPFPPVYPSPPFPSPPFPPFPLPSFPPVSPPLSFPLLRLPPPSLALITVAITQSVVDNLTRGYRFPGAAERPTSLLSGLLFSCVVAGPG